jgi:hypothetical protein
MSTENKNTPASAGYGFSEDSGPGEATLVFGLNAGNVKLTKFEFITNAGKGGTEGDAMEVVFTVKGKEKSHRQFPVTRAYIEDPANPKGANIEVTEESHPGHDAIKKAKNEMSALLVHIVGNFVDKEAIKAALSIQIKGFKHFCSILQGLLPTDFAEKPLDAFGVWQWQIGGENKQTYLEFPKNMKHGRWLSPAIAPVGEWTEQRKPNADSNQVAIRYVDEAENVHPFNRNGWFMTSNFAAQQREAPSQGAANMQQSSGASSTSW